MNVSDMRGKYIDSHPGLRFVPSGLRLLSPESACVVLGAFDLVSALQAGERLQFEARPAGWMRRALHKRHFPSASWTRRTIVSVVFLRVHHLIPKLRRPARDRPSDAVGESGQNCSMRWPMLSLIGSTSRPRFRARPRQGLQGADTPSRTSPKAPHVNRRHLAR